MTEPNTHLKLRQWWIDHWLPTSPRATDKFHWGLPRVSREKALERRYVEVNPKPMQSLIVVDLDHSDSVLRAVSAPAIPNIIVANSRNGHAHAIWALAEPVTCTETSRRGPVVFAAAVTEGLRRATGGDPAYVGLLTKNPLHQDWASELLRVEPWTLHALADTLGADMPTRGWLRAAPREGTGRNCTIFETVRRTAYREMRHYFGRSQDFLAAIERLVQQESALLADPLPQSECRMIARSVHNWIVRKSDLWLQGPAAYQAKFHEMQSARSRKRAEWREEFISNESASTGQGRRRSARELAEEYGRTERTIRRALSEPRTEYEARARGRQELALRLHQKGLSYAQVAERLGVSRDSAAGLVRRARRG